MGRRPKKNPKHPKLSKIPKVSQAKRSAGTEESIRPFQLRVAVKNLEIVRGYDGLFRGVPEPIVLLAAFLLDGESVRPLGRQLIRFAIPQNRFPCTVANLSIEALGAKSRAGQQAKILLLMLALEEDSGEDILRIYTHLAEAKHWRIWRLEDPVPSPMAVMELGAMPLPTLPYLCSVGVVDDGHELRDICKDDTLVGAGLVMLGTGRWEDEFRIRFLSADERNDWTARVEAHVE